MRTKIFDTLGEYFALQGCILCIYINFVVYSRAARVTSVNRINHRGHLEPDIYDIITNISAKAREPMDRAVYIPIYLSLQRVDISFSNL